MRILSIDTSTRLGSIALTEDGRLIVQEQQGVPGTHSERLLVSIQHELSLAGWSRRDIDAIVVAVGPGSFTGLRIGVATAKGMALAMGCKIAGVSSLESLALNCRGMDSRVLTMIDARRGEIYAALWDVPERGRPKAVMKECVLPPDALIAKMGKFKGRVLLTGDGALEYGERVRKALGKRAVIAGGGQCYPQAANLAEIAAAKLKRGGDDVAKLALNYIRRSDAEIGFKGRP